MLSYSIFSKYLWLNGQIRFSVEMTICSLEEALSIAETEGLLMIPDGLELGSITLHKLSTSASAPIQVERLHKLT
jgi:hypothetical protein